MTLEDSIATKNKASKGAANPTAGTGRGLNEQGQKDPTIREF